MKNKELEFAKELKKWLKEKKYGYFHNNEWINYGDPNDSMKYGENERQWELSRNQFIDNTINKIDSYFKDKDPVIWLQHNYLPFINFCKEKYSDFPEVCDRIVVIVSLYLRNKFKDSKIIIESGEYKNRYHQWLNIDNQLVDLTKFQFEVSDEDFNNKKFNLYFDIVSQDLQFYHTINQTYIDDSIESKEYFNGFYGDILEMLKDNPTVTEYLERLKNINI